MKTGKINQVIKAAIENFRKGKKKENGFKGKAIYNPSGKAKEYSYWACNFYVGCSNGCTYCYLKKGRGAKYLGGDKPVLKKCFKDEAHALNVFEIELRQNLEELQKHGMFFTFTSDPCLPETIDLTFKAIKRCHHHNVPVKLLTKNIWFVDNQFYWDQIILDFKKELIAFGFTLTGHDELEPGASTNAERIEAMRQLNEDGFKTFASIEPIIDFKSSFDMILKSYRYCDLFKIGLLSGQKYPIENIGSFMSDVEKLLKDTNCAVYYKDSVLSQLKLSREYLKNPIYVTRKYNIFTGGDECLMECTGCDKEFDIEDMTDDDGGNWFCPECWKVLAPVMAEEYKESLTNGDIEE